MGWNVVSSSNSGILAIHAAQMPKVYQTGDTGSILYFAGDEHDLEEHTQRNIDKTRLFWCSDGRIFSKTSPNFDTFCSGHAVMADGSLLIAGGTLRFPASGGHHGDHFLGVRDTWFYHPFSDTWNITNDMHMGRWYPTLITLPDGKVLAMGGHPDVDVPNQHHNHIPEIYDPSTRRWTRLGQAGTPDREVYYPRLHVLPDGWVFSSTPLDGRGKSHRYNPANGTLQDVSNAPSDNFYHGFQSTSVLLPLLHGEGYRARVLLFGGTNPQTIDLGSASPSWSNTPPRALSGSPVRFHSNAVILPTGDVFMSGGVRDTQNDATAVREAELYRTANNSWQVLEAATVPRNYHSVALLMPDGSVWTAGSNVNSQQSFPPGGGDARRLEIEVYKPSYFNVTRPSITTYDSQAIYGSTFALVTNQPASSIAKVALIRAGSVTHAFNSDQRYVEVPIIARSGNTVRAQSPPNANVAPPGYYLLFIINQAGIPSEGQYIKVSAGFTPSPLIIMGQLKSASPARSRVEGGALRPLTISLSFAAGITLGWLLGNLLQKRD